MTPSVRLRVAILLVIAPAALAQQLTFGEPIPLSNTYYSAQAAQGVLTANDRHAYLAWASPSSVRFTRVDGINRVGRPVLELEGVTELDVVWTGSHFFLAAVRPSQGSGGSATIVGRLLDRNGDPAGEPFELAARGERPRLASNGTAILLLYRTREEIRALRLSATGTPVAPATAIVTRTVSGDAGSGHDVASNGRGFAALTVDGHTVQGTIFNQLGLVTRQATMSVFRLDRGADASVALATDGEDYLGVWPNGTVLLAAILESNGQLGDTFGVLYGTGNLRSPALTFDGAHFHAAALGRAELTTFVKFVEIDQKARTAEAHGSGVNAAEDATASLVAIGDQVLAAWRELGVKAVQVRDLNRAAGTGMLVTVGADEQTLVGATSSAQGVLAIWSEVFQGRRSTRSGIWKYDGGWIETEVTGVTTPRLVASDGTGFAFIGTDTDGWYPYLLDREGRPHTIGSRVRATEVFDIVFAGTFYMVAYTDEFGQPAVARFGRDLGARLTLVLSDTVPNDVIPAMSLASDGRNVLVAWQHDVGQSCAPPCDPVTESLKATLLGPDLQRLIPEDLPLAGPDAYHPQVGWDGDEYRTVWHTDSEFIAGTVTAAGERLRITRRIADASPEYGSRHDMDLVELDGAVALTWKESNGPFLLITDTTAVPFEAPVGGPRASTRTADGGVAFFGTELRMLPPHHGARRVVVRFGGSLTPNAVPDPPIVSVERFSNHVRVTWTAPPEPVRGYRLEYRRGDGSWNEYGQWFDENQRVLTWTDLRQGESLAFRVRAVTEAGMSLYSVPAMIHIGKRRSVR